MEPQTYTFSSGFFCKPPKSRSVNTISTISERFEKRKGSDSPKKSILGLKMTINDYKPLYRPILGMKVDPYYAKF